jgi:hypothetical protein
VHSAIADAEAEVKGLRTRITKARTTVTSLLVHIEDGDSDPACRAQLSNVEQRLLAGERRLAQMKEHLARLRELESVATRLASTITSTASLPTAQATTISRAVRADEVFPRANGEVR